MVTTVTLPNFYKYGIWFDQIWSKHHVVPGWMVLTAVFSIVCWTCFSISIAYSAGKVSRVVAHPTPLNDEEQGDLDCRNHGRRMYGLSLLLSYMAHVVCSGDVNGKKGDQVPCMVVLSGPSIVVLQCLVFRVLWFMWIFWRRHFALVYSSKSAWEPFNLRTEAYWKSFIIML